MESRKLSAEDCMRFVASTFNSVFSLQWQAFLKCARPMEFIKNKQELMQSVSMTSQEEMKLFAGDSLYSISLREPQIWCDPFHNEVCHTFRRRMKKNGNSFAANVMTFFFIIKCYQSVRSQVQPLLDGLTFGFLWLNLIELSKPLKVQM